MVYSLIKAKSWLSKYPCIVSYGDIFYEKKAITKLIKEKIQFQLLMILIGKNCGAKDLNIP